MARVRVLDKDVAVRREPYSIVLEWATAAGLPDPATFAHQVGTYWQITAAQWAARFAPRPRKGGA